MDGDKIGAISSFSSGSVNRTADDQYQMYSKEKDDKSMSLKDTSIFTVAAYMQ